MVDKIRNVAIETPTITINGTAVALGGTIVNIVSSDTEPTVTETNVFWFDTTVGELKVRYSNTWLTVSGTPGNVGYVGSSGPAGGYTGSAGFIGSVGFVGSVGPSGGYTGSRGYAGSAGYTGSRGYLGGTGYTGSIGYIGPTGYAGSAGPAGGYTGSVGYVGSQGPAGGYTGSAGYVGSASTAVGYTGSAGTGGSGGPDGLSVFLLMGA